MPLDESARLSPVTSLGHDLLRRVRATYADLMPLLEQWRGHCREVAAVAYHLADALGISAARCHGSRWLPPDTRDTHSWVRLSDGSILHSPAPGEVELRVPVTSDEFIEDWRCGPAPVSTSEASRTGDTLWPVSTTGKPLSRVLAPLQRHWRGRLTADRGGAHGGPAPSRMGRD